MEVQPDLALPRRFRSLLGIKHKCGNSLKDSKLRIELSAMLSWPKYATYKEDYSLCNQTKWSRFNGSRPIFWDMTNDSAVQFSSASLQRVTYSDYTMVRIAGKEVLVFSFVVGY